MVNLQKLSLLLSESTSKPSDWKGAVVFLLDDEGIYFIRRSELVPTHKGQIGFMGGHRKSTEIDPWEVAQREFEEESGFSRSILNYVGQLPEVYTNYKQSIVPVVATMNIPREKFLELVQSNGEWDEILFYSWKNLLQEHNWDYARRIGHELTPVMFHPIRPSTYTGKFAQDRFHLLWGATAGMVWSLLQIVHE